MSRRGLILVAGLAAAAAGCERRPTADLTPVERGAAYYRMSCANCHGTNAEGRGLLGSDLRSNEFIGRLGDEELGDFIRQGRPATHPDNLSGIEMPPRGGNFSLTDEQVDRIVDYLRSLQ